MVAQKICTFRKSGSMLISSGFLIQRQTWPLRYKWKQCFALKTSCPNNLDHYNQGAKVKQEGDWQQVSIPSLFPRSALSTRPTAGMRRLWRDSLQHTELLFLGVYLQWRPELCECNPPPRVAAAGHFQQYNSGILAGCTTGPRHHGKTSKLS